MRSAANAEVPGVLQIPNIAQLGPHEWKTKLFSAQNVERKTLDIQPFDCLGILW